MLITFRDILTFFQVFLSPQVKRRAIICNKHGIYELSHELLKDLRSRTLRSYEGSGIPQDFTELYPSAQPSFRNENFVNTSKKPLKNRNWTSPVMRYFT